MFGFVFGAFPEMGYFNLAELEEINRKYGMGQGFSQPSR